VEVNDALEIAEKTEMQVHAAGSRPPVPSVAVRPVPDARHQISNCREVAFDETTGGWRRRFRVSLVKSSRATLF
jgi:hypothetical protein